MQVEAPYNSSAFPLRKLGKGVGNVGLHYLPTIAKYTSQQKGKYITLKVKERTWQNGDTPRDCIEKPIEQGISNLLHTIGASDA